MASTSTASSVSDPNGRFEKGFALFKLINFTFDHATAECVQGHFVVSETACQPFGVLHGGVSAYIAETLGSFGGGIASGKRVAGIELNINHLHAARIGEEIVATATPILTGNRIQVWDIKLSAPEKKDSTTETNPPKIYTIARLTLLVGITSKGSDLGMSTRLFSNL